MPEFLPNIKHFVYLMLENRSFDNLMGWLYEHEAPAHIIDGPTTHGQPFMGLEPCTYWNCFHDDPTPHYVQRGAASMNTPDPDPHEPFLHVNRAYSRRGWYYIYKKWIFKTSSKIMSK